MKDNHATGQSIDRLRYLRALEAWAGDAKHFFYTPPSRPDLLCYGTGDAYSGWGVQTNQKAVAAFATLATDPHLDEVRAGVTRETLVAWALAMLRFALATHTSGDATCTDGGTWGHNWLDPLGVERMMFGVSAIDAHLTDEDRKALRRVRESESTYLLREYPIEADIENSKPESNLWQGATLLRTTILYPDLPLTGEYREKGLRFLVNGISVARDALSDAVVDGVSVADAHVGANFTECFALSHHGYLNIGYMVICLSQVAFLHFAYKEKGITPPPLLYHHVKELWDVIRIFIAGDGRLIRAGGDGRVRYCYCQDYLLPVLLFILDYFDDTSVIPFEAGWLATVEREREWNEDGSFLSNRLVTMRERGHTYYTRLESDRACTFAMARYFSRVFTLPALYDAVPPAPPASWDDTVTGACIERNETRFTSFVWHANKSPMALALPHTDGTFAEWRYNACSEIRGGGEFDHRRVLSHTYDTFKGGFITQGRVMVRTYGFIHNSLLNEEDVATEEIAFCCLPDGVTSVSLQRAAVIDVRRYLNGYKGGYLRIPNDVYNEGVRSYFHEGGEYRAFGITGEEEARALSSSWVNVDNAISFIGITGAETVTLYHPGRRNVCLEYKGQDQTYAGYHLYADEICYPYAMGYRSYDPGERIFDIGFAICVGMTHEETRVAVEEGAFTSDDDLPEDVRALAVRGRDGKHYRVIANFGASDALLPVFSFARAHCLVSGREVASDTRVRIPAGCARVYVAGV